MPPKRPPPLPRSLFTDGGLSNAVPQPPSPSKIHPAFVTDGHVRAAPVVLEGPNAPKVTGAVVVVPSDGASASANGTSASAIPDGVKSKTVEGTVVDDKQLPGSIVASEAHVDLIVPNTAPLTEAEWDHLEEVVNQIDGGFKRVEGEVAEHGDAKRKIIIAGLLPPPLTKPSSPLLQSADYTLYQGRLAQLSLHADVVLKALPPVADTRVGDSAWWDDPSEVDRVVKMYMAPAIETFGTHRIVFGSNEAAVNTDDHVSVPITGAKWYALLRKTVSELGQDQEAMNHVMGENAQELYGLK